MAITDSPPKEQKKCAFCDGPHASEVVVDFDVDVAAADAVVAVDIVAASVLVFVGGAAASTAFSRVAVVDLVAVDSVGVEVEAGMKTLFLCP